MNEGLDRQLEGFLKEHKDARLIIIDTLQKVREVGGDRYSYSSDYEIVTKLKSFSDKYGICLLVVHHTRKLESEDSFDMISGTNGLLGAADGAFIMHKKKRTDNEAVLDFEKQERAKEVAELEAEKESLEEQNAAILQTSEKWLGELENLEQEIHSAQENREVADKKAEVAKKEAARYEKKLAEIAPMVKDMERFAVKYSYDPEEVLLEAGTLESGKTYREKKAKPLIEKIIMVLRSVYREYLNISNRLEKLQDAYSREQDRNERLKNRLEESLEENRELRTIATDFGRVKTVMGAEQVNAVIDRARQQEQIEVEQKRAVKRKHSMEVR